MTKFFVFWLCEGFVEAEKEGVKEQALTPAQVLKAIEKCINAFWVFVKTDKKKSWPKFRRLLWANQLVEDPRDLELLADLSKRLQMVYPTAFFVQCHISEPIFKAINALKKTFIPIAIK